ncbi:MAG: potassium channel family protein [Candidatus Dormibacterales bacterium]
MSVVLGVGGLLLIALVAYDVFQSVVLPRPAVGRIRLSIRAIKILWTVWGRAAGMIRSVPRREAALASFAPGAVLVFLFIWAMGFVLGYAMVLDALPNDIQPPHPGLGGALYTSALSLFTLGFGGVVPVGAAARAVVISEAAIGVGMIALVISLLFSLFSSFQRRETLVVTLDASAGAPPSGIALLESHARFAMTDHLEQTFDEWKHWTADVLESHLAYPILIYFRSSHDNEAWINSFGAVMDAAALVITAVDGAAKGPAHLFFKVGRHLVEDLSWYFRIPASGPPGVEQEDFEAARERLADIGYHLREGSAAWEDFAALRVQYAPALGRLAARLMVPPAPWLGDRSYAPHSEADRAPASR